MLYQLRQPGAGKLIAPMLLVAAVCGLIYGLVAGTFSGGTQLWAAPVKIAGGLMVRRCICLPSLYIFTCLSGSQARLVEVCGLLAGLLMLMTILSSASRPWRGFFRNPRNRWRGWAALHLIFWFIATCFGFVF